eukprot:3487832-Rhodomonas_salina.1
MECVNTLASGAHAISSTRILTRLRFLGQVSGCSARDHGGVIQAKRGAHVTLRSARIEHGVSGKSGGGIALIGSELSMAGSVISNCSARESGGGVWVSDLSRQVWSTDTLLYSEELYPARVSILDSTLAACTAEQNGGALSAEGVGSLVADSVKL